MAKVKASSSTTVHLVQYDVEEHVRARRFNSTPISRKRGRFDTTTNPTVPKVHHAPRPIPVVGTMRPFAGAPSDRIVPCDEIRDRCRRDPSPDRVSTGLEGAMLLLPGRQRSFGPSSEARVRRYAVATHSDRSACSCADLIASPEMVNS